MRQASHEEIRDYGAIIAYIRNVLTSLYMALRQWPTKIAQARDELIKLDNANGSFFRVLHNKREHNKKMLDIVTASLCIFLDYLLLYTGLSVLCVMLHWSALIQIAVPILLVLGEIGISYSSLIERRIGRAGLQKVLQFCIIGFLIGFSVFVVYVSTQGYNPQFDGGSQTNFLLKNAVVQLMLLVPSILLHIWIIRHADDIADAIAYFIYRWHRASLESTIRKTEELLRKDTAAFIKKVQELLEAMEAFRRNYPDSDVNFSVVVPADMAATINALMGRVVFPVQNGGNNLLGNWQKA